MITLRGWCRYVVLASLAGALLATGPPDSAGSHGNYCGGEAATNPTRPIDFTEWCRLKYGATASAVVVKQDAYGLVCRVPGKPDADISAQDACHKKYGNDSLAVLLGIGPADWRCVKPEQVARQIVPVLLFPAHRVKPAETGNVFNTLRRIETLIGGVRHFYRTFSYVYLGATTAFVLPTATSANEWQTLAPTALGPEWLSGAYHVRARQELEKSGWGKIGDNTLVRIAAFVALGTPGQLDPGPPTTPATTRPRSFLSPSAAWALPAKFDVNLPALRFLSLALSASDASCTPGSPNVGNSPAYESAFFQVGNRLGASLGLPRTDQYAFGGLLLRPDNFQQSIMFSGNGTRSVLFPFEAATLYTIWGSLK